MSTPRAPQNSARLPANIGQFMGAYRNKVINGDFDIWQRSTSVAVTGSGYYAADRVRVGGDFTGSTCSVSRQAHTVGQTDVPGNPEYFYRFARTVTGSGNVNPWSHRIEGVGTLAGKKATFTAYLKGTAGKTVDIHITQNFGTGGSPSASLLTDIQLNVVLSASWTKVQYVFDVPSIAGKTLGSNDNDFLEPVIIAQVGDGNMTIDISHVSLVEGDATGETDPFSPRHIQQEEMLCKRYYEAITVPSSACLATLQCTSATGGVGAILYTPKRTTPTVTIPTGFQPRQPNGTLVAPSSWSAVPGIDRSRIAFAGASGLTAGHATDIATASTQTATIDAEL